MAEVSYVVLLTSGGDLSEVIGPFETEAAATTWATDWDENEADINDEWVVLPVPSPTMHEHLRDDA